MDIFCRCSFAREYLGKKRKLPSVEEIWCSQICSGEACRYVEIRGDMREGVGVLCISTHSKFQKSDEKRPFVNDEFHKLHHAVWEKDTCCDFYCHGKEGCNIL